MHTNKVKTEEKQENNEFKIQESGYFFMEERRNAIKVGKQRAPCVLAMLYCG